MIAQIVFMGVVGLFAAAVIWRSVKKKSKKSCCE